MTQPTAPANEIPRAISEEMRESYLTYAMSVIMARALPDVRDGLKPSQRRILVAMNDLNLGPRAKHRKCAKIAGDTSGNYHPHGEGVIYPTLVRMGQEWAMRHLLIDPQGNFGSIDGDPPAAMRYTEARLTLAAELMLEDLDKDTVDFEDNYDGTRQEPVVLPSKFPNLLVNGSEGIAVGMATRLLPHNLAEICDAVSAVINDPDIGVDELMRIVPGPDFPTGGVICGNQGVRDAYSSGHGSLTVRGVMHVEETKSGKPVIVVDQIPYGILLPTVKERIMEAVENGTLKGVEDVRDESGRQAAIRVVITLKKDGNVNVVMNQLWQYTPMQMSVSALQIALVNRVPQTLSLKELIEHFIRHRTEVIRRRTMFLLRKARQRAHILEGLILAVADIDDIIRIIRASPDPDAARAALMAKPLRLSERATVVRLLPAAFVASASGGERRLSRAQADAILAMPLRRLTGLEIEQLAGEYGRLVDEIAGYELILADERRVLDIIVEDMQELKSKLGEPRRTQITAPVGELQMEQLIQQERVIVSISHEGYIKRVPLDTYRAQGRGGKGVKGTDSKEGDFIEHLFVASTHDYLLFFTNRGRVYWLRVYDIPSMSRTSRGRSLPNVLTMQANERHMAVLPVAKFEENFVFFATEKGVVKKTPLTAFANPRPSGIIALTLDPDDSLIGVALTGGSDQVVIGTRRGMACRFRESDVRPMGRSARGVKGITLGDDDRAVDLVIVPRERLSSHAAADAGPAGGPHSADEADGDASAGESALEAASEPDAEHPETETGPSESVGVSILTVCENGFGKRTDVGEYRLTHRGGKGVINIRVTEKNGQVVAIRAVTDEDQLMLITSKGTLLRMELRELREIGRATQGVRLIRVADDDRVVAVAKMAAEKDDGGDARGAPPPDEGRSGPEA